MDANFIETKVDLLIASFKEIQKERDQLKKLVTDQSTKLKDLQNELNQYKDEYNNVIIARNIMGSGLEKDDTRKEINGLVREIDKCIALLNT